MAGFACGRVFGLAVLICLGGFAANGQGLAPRRTPAEYGATDRSPQTTYAASLLSADQVKHIFALDISRSYLVFEIAIYPDPNSKTTVDADAFLIKAGKKSDGTRTADATTVASVMQQKNMPRDTGRKDVSVYPSARVGYESGTDPYTGRKVHGTYTEVGVAATKDPIDDPNRGPRYPPASGVDPQQVQALEDQLAKKALTSGEVTKPAAGYIYFPMTKGSRDTTGVYAVSYLGDSTAKIELSVPSKSR